MACLPITSLRTQKAYQQAKCVFMRCVPHALLCIVYLLYLVFGAIIFRAIEETGFTQLEIYRRNVDNMRGRLEAAMWNNSHGTQVNATTNLTLLLDEYTDLVSQPEWKVGRLIAVQNGVTWSFSSIMFFCLTTIATIGYGDIVPLTRGGRVFVGFYATFGIPLNVIFLADVGYLMAKLIVLITRTSRMWYINFRREKSVERDSDAIPNVSTAARPPARSMTTTRKLRRKPPDGISQSRALSFHGPRSIAKRTDHLTLDPKRRASGDEDGIQASGCIMSTHSTKHVEVKGEQRVETKHDRITSQFQDTSFINEQVADLAEGEHQLVARQAISPDVTAQTSDDGLQGIEKKPHRGPLKKNTEVIVVNNNDTRADISEADNVPDSMDPEDGMAKTEVSLVVVLVILIIIMCFGAGIIATIEGWEYSESFYFTFITLTTIGYGDVLPTKFYDKDVFFFCIIYTVIGLAVMSTCIALVQAKILRAIDKFAQWIVE